MSSRSKACSTRFSFCRNLALTFLSRRFGAGPCFIVKSGCPILPAFCAGGWASVNLDGIPLHSHSCSPDFPVRESRLPLHLGASPCFRMQIWLALAHLENAVGVLPSGRSAPSLRICKGGADAISTRIVCFDASIWHFRRSQTARRTESSTAWFKSTARND